MNLTHQIYYQVCYYILIGNDIQIILFSVLKRVEDLEENRVKKHRSFEMRHMNWRQRLKRLFSRKELSFEEDADDQKDEIQGVKMSKEEMEKVEKEVESAKIDLTAFNIITDQIAILSNGFESEKERKKRIKKEQKEQKKLEKEVFISCLKFEI